MKEYAAGFLVTFVEREGQMAGIDIPAIKELVSEIKKGEFGSNTQLTIAGGVTTLDDLRALDALGVEGQVTNFSFIVIFCYFLLSLLFSFSLLVLSSLFLS